MVTREEVAKSRLLSAKDVLAMWPIHRNHLSRVTNHPRESERLPSYQFGRRRFYRQQELDWYLENHRYTPRKRRAK